MKLSMMQVRMGEELPRFSGVAWHEMDTMNAVVLPVPLNVVAGWLHQQWLNLRHGVQPAAIERIVNDAYNAGRRSGLTLTRYHLAKEFQRGADYGQLKGIRQSLAAFGPPPQEQQG